MTAPILFAALALLQASTAAIPEGPDLYRTIAARDAALFEVMFDKCDPAALGDLVTEDVEFYHDKGGRMAGREAFVTDYAQGCEAKKAPDAWRSRRELTGGSMNVFPIPGYGAVEEGVHQFYERKGEGPEKLVGRAHFSVLWTLEVDGHWRMSRAFSVGHVSID